MSKAVSAPRRLCMIVHAEYPRAETRVEREAHAAQQSGWEVDVIAMSEPGAPAQEIGDDGVRIFRLPVRRVRGASALSSVREYLGFTLLALAKIAQLQVRRRYAVVQVHNPPDFLLMAAVPARIRGARVVLDVHDLAPELFALRFGGRRGGRELVRVLRVVERLALRLADRVVTVHEPYRRLLVARGVPDRKITIALNSPEDRLLPEASSTAKTDTFRVVYHGTVNAHYGLETLIEAVSLSRDKIMNLTVEIYGGGDALDDVKRCAEALGVGDCVSFSDGFLGNREVLERVAGAQVGVVCNLPVERNQSALPTKLFEYAALRIPIVSSDLDAVKEYFSDDEVQFFAAGDTEALARAISAIAHDPDGAAERASRALARYGAYRWSESSRSYVAMLEELAR